MCQRRREVRGVLKIVAEVPAHHGAATWAELDPEGAELLADTTGRMRELLDELAAALKRRQ
jgi:hypothetical protein